ncbi:MAG: laccase domain-containing protein [Acidimicrobiales bacterium]
MIERRLPAGPHHEVRVRCSSRADGDFHIDRPAAELASRRAAFAPAPWTWLRQVHGPRVVTVDAPGEHAGAEADAGVTTTTGAVLAVQTADCVPVVLAAAGGLAVAHAGWRGVVEGVIPAAVESLRTLADGEITAFVGPRIGVGHYAFGDDDLAEVIAVAGPSARGRTVEGHTALDMTAAVLAVLADLGVGSVDVLDADTADDEWFSHRVRGDAERQVTVAWMVER